MYNLYICNALLLLPTNGTNIVIKHELKVFTLFPGDNVGVMVTGMQLSRT